MKKKIFFFLAISLVGLFFYYNRDLFLSTIDLPRSRPEYIEVVITAANTGNDFSWRLDSSEKMRLITNMLFQGIELHSHTHEPVANIKIFYPDKETITIYLYHGHVGDSFEFSYKEKTFVIDKVTFLNALKGAGVDVSLLSHHVHHH